ncbi:MAG TPA: 1,4-alpha-glucan branching protein GlgB [Gemmatimonadaceae bacterium]|nr:1,4-alpha-glucan branching protein GlgB [Gemmatimonadaceae bacterium]
MSVRAPGHGPIITADDLYLLGEGTHFRMYRHFGAHPAVRDGTAGTTFAVWAPNAARVSVIGDFNGWRADAHPLALRGDAGIWTGFVAGAAAGDAYKYHIVARHGRYQGDKADPVAFRSEEPPRQASVIWPLDYEWHDQAWMDARRQRDPFTRPMSIYEVHLGSWQRNPEEGHRLLTYRELAERLVPYVVEMGFTHVELLPVMEHPFYGSWGYQTTSYFAPSSRYGAPQDFMHLVDTLHAHGIGVLLDWVPSHFPMDGHALVYFDGTHLYEHEDPREGFHPDWNSAIFNYGRHEVRSFLISSALFWLDVYHADGLRVDAVASMLYRDYSRKAGEWIPNRFGGRENLEAVAFLRRLNEEAYRDRPGVVTVAEESTAWPMVSRPPYIGGLGFGMKWDMGWMHDTLRYFSRDPLYRKYAHNELTFRGLYLHTENYVLPLSHDEVVHGKGSLLGRMPGDRWQRFANLRLLLGYQYAQPGKKLLFMGGEFGQEREWNHDESLDWHLLGDPMHEGVRHWVRDLNHWYRSEPAMYEMDFELGGFSWIDCSDAEQSTVLMLRQARSGGPGVILACNFTPVPRRNYGIGVPEAGRWAEVLNSDAPVYGGSGQGNMGGVDSVPVARHGCAQSITATLPPLAMIVFRRA